MIHLQERWGFALLFLIASIPSLAQGAPAVRQRSLIELTQKSDSIIRGTVVSAVVKKHPTLPHLSTVVVKVRVAETLKGSPDDMPTPTFSVSNRLASGPTAATSSQPSR